MSKVSDVLIRAFTFVSPPETEVASSTCNESKQNQTFNIKYALLDAFILAMSTFFSTLLAIGTTKITQDPVQALLTAGIAAGAVFFETLAAKRGLKKGNQTSG